LINPNLLLSDGTLIRYDQVDDDDQMSVPSQVESVKSYGQFDKKHRRLLKINWITDGEFKVYGKYVILNKRFAEADGDDLERWDRIRIYHQKFHETGIKLYIIYS
jgi:hypothetical protein